MCPQTGPVRQRSQPGRSRGRTSSPSPSTAAAATRPRIQLARCGTRTKGRIRKRVVVGDQVKMLLPVCSGVHPMNSSRARHFQAAAPNSRQASSRPRPSRDRVLQVLADRAPTSQVVELRQGRGETGPGPGASGADLPDRQRTKISERALDRRAVPVLPRQAPRHVIRFGGI